jgi:hypothetical protein
MSAVGASHWERRSTESRLLRELASARDEYRQARDECQRLSDELTRLPHPDGAQCIRNAGAARRYAMKAYIVALERFNAFILDGVIPEDLLRDSYGNR